MNTIIFWGAGKIGKRMLDLWRQFGVQPDFFADNAQKLWGTLYYGIRVLSIEELKSLDKAKILITCGESDSISNQLITYGIKEENIFRGNTWDSMLLFLTLHMRRRLKWNNPQMEKDRAADNSVHTILFDVQYGFVLGGVEAWVRQMADVLEKQNNKVKFITTDIKGWTNQENDDRIIYLQYGKEISEIDRFMKCLCEIGNNVPCNIICNFVDYTFRAACMAKTLWPREVNLIVVVHSDDEVYYKQYNDMRHVIDYCLVTCDMMEEYFARNGMDKKRIRRLMWQIPCPEVLERTYSRMGQPLRIGYAGRIVKIPKRMDLLAEIIRELKSKSVDFRLEIAGEGEYEDELRKSLDEMMNQIKFVGRIARERIPDFWKNQDIGINCSDLEGRCISKAESMAAGAVPVITDTSSARDDVIDGYNGYVVSVGDVDGIVDRMCYLYHHRELLEVMGRRSHQIILEQNARGDLMDMWNRMLKNRVQ